jgi:hypothetical protein
LVFAAIQNRGGNGIYHPRLIAGADVRHQADLTPVSKSVSLCWMTASAGPAHPHIMTDGRSIHPHIAREEKFR